MTITPIAYLRSPFCEKFGIPRQSRLAESVPATIEFAPGYRSAEAVRGLDAFSHIWLIWGFSEAQWEGNFTVRPPRLGGNTRIGVFASRSPFRPNSLGISAVRLLSVEMTADRGPVLHVLGADLLDGTPIYDIKPYIPYTDRIPEATDGYTAPTKSHRLAVEIPPEVTDGIAGDTLAQIRQLLEIDPRVSYDSDPAKVWGMAYERYNVRFTVAGNIATVVEITGT
ncbi:MAG: tRNA (N6-threonylcarbamoyladenosine(37)-N6)-methyltransferase TrmO [Bacteroidales bacterium]|nr:tRNA (N6-threonylcarbamoyladenosine(37)-N6)-methyltransferase TrmO [Bacteroidales bacterium]